MPRAVSVTMPKRAMPATFSSERSVSRCAIECRPSRRRGRVISFEAGEQRGRIPAIAAHCLHVAVELVDEGGDRQLGAVAAGFGRARCRDPCASSRPQSRSRYLPAFIVLWRFSICQEPAAPLEITSIDLFNIEAGALAEMQRFGESLDEAGDADLVDHLGELAGACRTHQADHAGIGVDDRPGAFEDGLVAAAHDGQHAVFGAGLAAGDGRIDEIDSPFPLPRHRVRGRLQRWRWCCRSAPHPASCRARRRSRLIVTERRSSSLPTQTKTKSAPSAASAGVGAAWPANFAAQSAAFAGVRL